MTPNQSVTQPIPFKLCSTELWGLTILFQSVWKRNRWNLASVDATLIFLLLFLIWGPGEDFVGNRKKSVLLPNKGFENASAPGLLVEGFPSFTCFLKFPWEGPPALGQLSELLFLFFFFFFFFQDDLLSLKVVSVLHHLSIKRAIQVLRINNFEPNCLRRRPSDEVAPEVEIPAACALHAPDSCAGKIVTRVFMGRQGRLLPSSEPQVQPHYLLGLYFPMSPPLWWLYLCNHKDCVLISLLPFLGCLLFSCLLKPQS